MAKAILCLRQVGTAGLSFGPGGSTPLRPSMSAILDSAGHRVVEADDGQGAAGLLE